MKPFFSVLTLITLILTTPVSFADSCPDQASQQVVGYNLAMANAKAALPGVQDLETKITDEKFHQLSESEKWWTHGADYLRFNIIIGTPSASAEAGYSPSVSYTVTVDTNCKATTLLDSE